MKLKKCNIDKMSDTMQKLMDTDFGPVKKPNPLPKNFALQGIKDRIKMLDEIDLAKICDYANELYREKYGSRF